MERIVNRTATIRKISDWSKRKNIRIPGFKKAMGRADWETTIVKVAGEFSIEIVYLKRLSEVNPKPGQWFSVLDGQFAEKTSVAFITDNGIAELSWVTRKPSSLFEPKVLTPDQAKRKLNLEINMLRKKEPNLSIDGKVLVKEVLSNMEIFYQKRFGT